MRSFIKNYIKDSIRAKELIFEDEKVLRQIEKATNYILEAYKLNKKVLIAGNGGSAADAQHIATELISKFIKNRPALYAIALTTNTSALTAIGNDFGIKDIFSRQIEAYGQEDDVYIAISTSGNSENIIKSIDTAKKNGIKVIGLTGGASSLMDDKCDVLIKVPSESTPIIQESHIMIGHLICALVEEKFLID